jgi:hypothetical protein
LHRQAQKITVKSSPTNHRAFLAQCHKGRNKMNGIKNCHVIGVDSIAWENKRGGLDRIFIANSYHELHTNLPNTDSTMSVGFHNHRSDLRISVLDGVVNELILFDRRSKPNYGCIDITIPMHKYTFSSYIKQSEVGESGFTKVESELSGFKHCLICMGRETKVERNATDFHTIHIPEGDTAIWKVEELWLNPFHVPTVISNDYRLDQFGKPHGMYTSMSDTEIKLAMQKVMMFL